MNPDIYLIKEIEGYTPLIGSLVSMMNSVRLVTKQTVAGLTTEQLDYLHDEKSNSIGMLLQHFASVEVMYQLETFEGRMDFNEEESKLWKAGASLGDEARKTIKNNNLEYYINMLDEVREKTLAEFRKRDDKWLLEETDFWDGLKGNNWFKWFHVFEDEINHKGQIAWLRKRLP
jgi:uncharacterized damage-inducible protein DinB